jgi:calcineurin-like phosphoesterase family protein
MRKVWFTADTHFGHNKIPFYAKRKFCLDEQESEKLDSIWRNKSMHNDWAPSWASIARMDDYLIRRINDCVAKDDILWHLGDFCYGKKGKLAETARKYRERINCKNVFLVAGNHDSPEVKRAFNGNYEYFELKVSSRIIVLSHYCQAFWNKSHAKSWMLYGHAHGSAEQWLDENMPGRLSMDVGVDNVFKVLGEYRPISFDEVSTLFSARKGFHIDGNKIRSALPPQKTN